MKKGKLIEISVKNKNHLACCDTIKEMVKDVDEMQQHMGNLQTELATKYNVPANVKESIAKHIAEVQQKHKELVEKAEICGCT